jgi:outer membrane protein assembly factor BamB
MGALVAVRPDGSGDVTKTHLDWTVPKGMPTRSSALFIDDLLYLVNDQGFAYCVEAKTGKVLKQERLGGNFTSSPVHADGRIYVSNQEGATYVIEPGRELKVLAVNELDTGCMASPAAVGKSLFVRTKTHLYCLEQK